MGAADFEELQAWKWCLKHKPSIDFSWGSNIPNTIILYGGDNLEGQGATLAEAVHDLQQAGKRNRTPFK